jgi:hypothetical protein
MKFEKYLLDLLFQQKCGRENSFKNSTVYFTDRLKINNEKFPLVKTLFINMCGLFSILSV